MFANEVTGNPITTFKRSHATALRRSQVAHFRLYDLRHTFATRFIESGGFDYFTDRVGPRNRQYGVEICSPD